MTSHHDKRANQAMEFARLKSSPHDIKAMLETQKKMFDEPQKKPIFSNEQIKWLPNLFRMPGNPGKDKYYKAISDILDALPELPEKQPKHVAGVNPHNK